MAKFTSQERNTIKSLVAALTIKRIPDNEIMKEITKKIGKTITRKTIYNVRNRIKKESYNWYKTLRQGEFDYIYEFKERINEIMDLQKRHREIINNNLHNPSIVQTSLAELHRLNITLSNYYDIAPHIVGNLKNDNSLSIKQQDKEIIV
jgi:alpha-galactosidase/6-phospho-beta-glucosidase family protein